MTTSTLPRAWRPKLGELLISEAAYRAAAGPGLNQLEQRQLELKGKREPVGVRVVQVTPSH